MKRYDNKYKCLFQLAFCLFLLTFVFQGNALAVVDYTFEWDASPPSENVVAYRIYWSTTSEDYNTTDREEVAVTSLADPDNPQWTITIPDPPPGEFYFFVCTAVDDQDRESGNSFEIDAAGPTITAPPTVTDVTNNTAVINWSTDESADSQVQYGDNSAAWGGYDSDQTDTNLVINHSMTITSLAADTVHYYRVGSTNGTGEGPIISAESSFTTDPDPDTTSPVITTPPSVVSVSSTTATIVWVTDEPSDSLIEYGLTTGYGSNQADATDVTAHSITLDSLSPLTTYQFRVGSQDIAGNPRTYSGNDSFTTDAAPDTTPPVIVSVPTVTSITDTTAIVQWETDEPATSIVEFGQNIPYARSTTVTEYVTDHTVSLTLLEGSTLYHFRVGSSDAAGNGPRYSSDGTFTTEPTPDTTAPVITTTPTVTGVTDTTATIEWDTDESSNSQVRYDTTAMSWTNLGSFANSAAMVTHHNVTITGLSNETTYYFRVGSTDAAGNGPDPSYTPDNNPTNSALSFTTQPDATAPVITSAPTVTAVSDTTATIEWDTDEPSNSQVRYATAAGIYNWNTYPSVKNTAPMVTHHSVTLTGLSNAQDYYFRVGSTDILGNGPDPGFVDDNNPTNSELNFTTLADQTPPTITAPPTVTGITDTTATIEWSTDEPSNSQVRYDVQSRTWEAYPSSQNDGAMVTNHSVTITGLGGDTQYYFRVGSTDAEGNGPTISNQVNFTTNTDPDTDPPQFSSPPTVTAKTNDTATIDWSTAEPSNSQVQYGLIPASWDGYQSSQNDGAMVTNHSVTLTGLSGSSTYYFRAGSTDTSGNGPIPSNEISFTTDPDPDVDPPQIVTPPTVTIKTNQTATIVWTTNEESNSVVQYDTESQAWGDYALTQSNAAMIVSHTLTLTNLNGDTLYYLRVGSTDASGNGPTTSTEVSFTTDPDPDLSPPQFTSPPTVITVDDTSAVIAWSTDEPGNSQVRYGTTTNEWDDYPSSENDADFVDAHSVTLTGLNDDTLYYFRAGSTDAAGNGPSVSNEITFRTDPTPDVDAPRITTPPTVTDKTISTATIEWETDEPSTSEVHYDEGSLGWNSYGYVENDSAMVTQHIVTIADLDTFTDCDAGGCTFYYMVGSTDAAGNGPDPGDAGNNNPFTEDSFATELAPDEAAPRIISGPAVTAVDATSVIIEWQTDEPSNSIVRYGETNSVWASYPDSEDDAALVTQHSVTLTDLNESTTYYYRVGSTDAAGNGPELNQDATNPSAESEFATEAVVDTDPPVVSNVDVAWVTNSTALITWTTDEPGNSQVRYDVSTGTWNTYGIFENDVDMVLNHSVTLANLQPDTLYYFMVGSADARGNGPAPSTQATFTTDNGPDVSAPQISNLVVQSLSGTTARVTWTTDEPGNSQVRYDTDSAVWQNYAFSENDGGLTTDHSVTLTGLSPATLYYVRVSSTDASGNNLDTSGTDINPSIERNLTTEPADPPSVIVFPNAEYPTKYPLVNAGENYIEITYDELNMQNAEGEGYYTIVPAMAFADPGNSIELTSSTGTTSTYQLSFDNVTTYTIYTLTLTEDITDADGYSVEPLTVTVNDNDEDDLPDDWEVAFGLDPASSNTTAGEGKTGDMDGDGYSNYDEFLSNTDPGDDTSVPSPPELMDSVPHHRAGINDNYRVPNNASFGVYVTNTVGIDSTNMNSVLINIDDKLNTPYDVYATSSGIVRVIPLDEIPVLTDLKAFWVVYDRSMDTYGDFPYDAIIDITVTVANTEGHTVEADYRFRIETEAEHNSAPNDPSIPDYSSIVVNDPPYNAGYQIDSGIMQGAIVHYDNTEPLIPYLAPTDGIPTFLPSGNVSGIGDLLNIQPPAVFSTPVKLIIPTQGVSASRIQIYVYNGVWTLASDTDGSSDLPGWMVEGSRINSASGITLKVYHFSGVHAAVVTPQVGDDDDDDDDVPPDDTANCFIRAIFNF